MLIKASQVELRVPRHECQALEVTLGSICEGNRLKVDW